MCKCSSSDIFSPSSLLSLFLLLFLLVLLLLPPVSNSLPLFLLLSFFFSLSSSSPSLSPPPSSSSLSLSSSSVSFLQAASLIRSTGIPEGKIADGGLGLRSVMIATLNEVATFFATKELHDISTSENPKGLLESDLTGIKGVADMTLLNVGMTFFGFADILPYGDSVIFKHLKEHSPECKAHWEEKQLQSDKK